MKRGSVERTVAWTIEIGRGKQCHTLGPFARPNELCTPQGRHVSGLATLLFATRRAAHDFLRPRKAVERERGDNWRHWLRCRVIPVVVTIRPKRHP